ncbi:MAG: choice-of-anchor J domain-containing protein [Bacteroidales bacterium]|nr:choice-of-anchor J domain-containing protein [Bacteroidales bacterium]
MKLRFTLLLSLVFIVLSTYSQTFYRTGSDDDIETEPTFGILLAGGATDNNDGMAWLANLTNGGDVVVLRASGSDGYNNYIYSGLGVQVNSVTSIVIQSQAQADNPDVCEAVANAEMVFIAGGNQWNYYSHWKGTCLQEALIAHVNVKSAPIGGTSAGLAVLGEVVFTAENGSVWSNEALGNPYHFRVTLANDFLEIPFLENLITDSHYDDIYGDGNNRHGRHFAFMSRMIADWDMDARGIGVDEYTAVGVDENGLARVFGHPSYDDYAYFLKANHDPEVCENGQPLTWYHEKKAVSVYKLKGDFTGSGTFDLTTWNDGEGGDWFYWYAQNGNLGYAAEVTFEIVGDFTGTLEAESEGLLLDSGDAVQLGATVGFFADPEEGKRVKQWIVNDEVQNEISQLFVLNNLENKIHVQVEFMEIPAGTYMVSFFPVGGNGALSASADGEEILNGASVNAGSDILFTALPDEGYSVAEWKLNGNNVLGENNEPFAGVEFLYENLESDVNVTVGFAETDPGFEAGIFLMWDVASTANTPAYREEYYSVWISAEGTQPEDFTMIFDETLDSSIPNWDYQARSLDISEYAGQQVYIAFRHHESTEKDRIMINNVKILISYEDPNEEPFLILDEDFQGGVEEAQGGEIDPAWLPDGWTAIDLDGDGQNWYYADFEGDGYMLSRSWLNPNPLTPDNWLITPPVILSDDPSSAHAILNSPREHVVTLYPNPASSLLTVVNKSNIKIDRWEMFSADGRRMLKSQTAFLTSESIDIATLKPGIYLLRVFFDDGSAGTMRFVKR